MGDYKKLEAWQIAHGVACTIYRTTTNFPKSETYGLAAQLRRSASSVAANIAEGCGRNGDAELSRFLRISLGSANELEYHLLLSHDVGILDPQEYHSILEDVLRLKSILAALERVLKHSPRQRRIADSG
jgi:four helix bundle protein